MRKIFYASALSVLLCVLIGFTPTVAHAATYTVTKTADTADGICSVSDCSLREAVIAANGGGADTIVIPAGTYPFSLAAADEELAATGDLDFTDTDLTTITGAGSGQGVGATIINASLNDRGIDVKTGAAVSIIGLTVMNGSLSTSGSSGAGIVSDGTLSLTNVEVTGNSVTTDGSTDAYGVGVACTGSSITITDSVISNNIGVSTSGNVFGGGLAITTDCNATLTRVSITGNQAFNGGGVAAFTDTNTMSFTDVTISNNTAGDAGGGIYTQGSGVANPLTITRALFESNVAVAGGGIFSLGPLSVTNASFYDNLAVDTGGAMSVQGDSPPVRLAFVTMTRNTAATAAAIYGGSVTPNTRVKNSIIASNYIDAENLDDCIGTLISEDYNYIAAAASCTITPQAHDVINVPAGSIYFTAIPSDQGGNVEVTALWETGVTLNMIPPASCTDGNDDPVLTDARGTSRPQNTNCDLGAFEFGHAAPPTAFTATAVGNDVNLAWTNSTDPHFASVTIRRSASAYPTSTTDGSAVASGVTGTTTTDSDLSDGAYYYSIFSLDDEGDISVAATATVTVDTVTQSPTLSSPGSGSMNRVRLQYALPEAPLAGSVRVTFTNVATSGTVVFQMENSQSVNFLFNPADSGNQVNFDNLSNINTITPSAMPVLADGTYTVTLSYRDSRNNPATTAVATGVIIDTTTQTPTLTSPASSSFNNALQLQYSLPEAPQSNTISVAFANGSGTTTLSMDTTQSVNTTLQLSSLSASSHVTSASASTLADGVYTVTLRYQDALGNPTISAVASTVTLDRGAPTISLLGNSAVTITKGDTYTDAGATATDAVQGTLTSSIVKTGSVDVNTVGSYTLRYNVQDSTGNVAAEVTRTVTVAAPAVVSEPVVETTPTTDSTTTDHGKITTVTKSNGELRVVYDNAATRTLTPYGASKNFRYALSTDKKRIVVTNGKDVRVFKNGVQVTKKIIGKTAYTNANYRIVVKKVYNGYDSVFIATAKGKAARVYALRLTSSNTLTKQKSHTFSIQDLSKPGLSVNKTNKQVTVAYGKSGKRVSRTWKLTTDGTFRLIQ
jgi:CSLREA domain-containing protein